jgi:hypothetical protein
MGKMPEPGPVDMILKAAHEKKESQRLDEQGAAYTRLREDMEPFIRT